MHNHLYGHINVFTNECHKEPYSQNRCGEIVSYLNELANGSEIPPSPKTLCRFCEGLGFLSSKYIHSQCPSILASI